MAEKNYPDEFPEQKQNDQPGDQHKMSPTPVAIRNDYKGSGKLKDKVALITGGDSGIGQSVAVHFAREGADVAVVYLEETKDANETKEMVEKEERECLLIQGDIRNEEFCRDAVKQTVNELGKLNVLVNNAAVQYPHKDFANVKMEDMRKTFETNIYSYFYFVHAALEHLSEGDSIINTTSVTAYRGSHHLVDYSSTKGAIVSFTRSLSANLAKTKRGIRVNGVAPGPIWTPLITATFEEKEVAKFGQDVPLGRAGQPEEVAHCYVFLASNEASYITGQILHPNGGEIING